MLARRSRKPTSSSAMITMTVATAAAARARAACHADGGDHPDAGRAGEPADAAAVVQNESGAEEADALNDIRGHLALVRTAVAGEHGRKQCEKRGAHADEQVGAHAGRAALDFALKADEAAQQAGQQQPTDGAIDDDHLLQPVEVEGRAKCWPMSCSYGCHLA